MANLGTTAIILINTEMLHLAYVVQIIPKEIHMIFHNGSNYDYHFIIEELAKEFEGEFEGKTLKNTKPFQF